MSQRARGTAARGAACVAALVGAVMATAQTPAQADPCTSSMVAPPAYCVPAQGAAKEAKAEAKEAKAGGNEKAGGRH